MAIYITGDTHGDFRRFLPESFPEQEAMTKEDILLIAGDFGGVWYGDSRDDEELDFMEQRPFTTAFVSGNNENYDALRIYPPGGMARRQSAAHLPLRAPAGAGAGVRSGWETILRYGRRQQPRYPGRHEMGHKRLRV